MSENRDNKFILVYILAGIFFGAIVYQWFKFAPYRANPKNKDNTWPEISQRASQALGAITDSFGAVQEKVSVLQEEAVQAAKQEIILEQAKKYLENLENSTSTSTTTSSSPVSNN